MKRVLLTHRAAAGHWVGDGFPVRTLFSHHDLGERVSPFLLLDYAGPATFPPSEAGRGVDEHPHRGFETVTLVYQGRLEHRDSAGNRGVIGPGDVQWMTAGAGVLHEERHERTFSEKGGTLEMVQLWVNLPRKSKGTAPRYQELADAAFPRVPLADGAGELRVIAGALGAAHGPAETFTPLNVWDGRLAGGHAAQLELSPGRNAMVVVLSGELEIDGRSLGDASLFVLTPEGKSVRLAAASDARFLILDGEPINEPVAAYGPFVMNTRDEIEQAVADLRAGRFGALDP